MDSLLAKIWTKNQNLRVQTEFLSHTNDKVVQNSDALNEQKAIGLAWKCII